MTKLPRPILIKFQSLTRDSNHSNVNDANRSGRRVAFQSLTRDSNHSNLVGVTNHCFASRFNPSRGIAIIQTSECASLACAADSFNPSRGIAIIQTRCLATPRRGRDRFQSLTRDSNHSNGGKHCIPPSVDRFNPSRGIAIIQTRWLP